MPTSDEDLAKQGEKVVKLREQVAQAEAERIERETAAGNEIAMLQLQAEEERLQTQLLLSKDQKKVASVKEGADAPLAAAKLAMEQAVNARKAVEASIAGPPEGTVPTSTPEPEVAATAEPKKGAGS